MDNNVDCILGYGIYGDLAMITVYQYGNYVWSGVSLYDWVIEGPTPGVYVVERSGERWVIDTYNMIGLQ